MTKTWQVVLAFVGIFLLGALAGSVVSVRVLRERQSMKRRTAPDHIVSSVMKKFTREFGLSDEQSAKILPLVTRASDEIRQTRRDALKATEASLDRMHGDIAAVLDERQRRLLKEFLEREHQRIAEWTREMHRPAGARPVNDQADSYIWPLPSD